MTPDEICHEVKKLQGRRPKQVKSYFVQMMVRRNANKAMAKSAKEMNLSKDVFNKAYHADWREIIPKIPDKSVKLIIADPPYGGYSWTTDGSYLSSRCETSGLRCDTDNATLDKALEVTLPLFDLCLNKLTDGGCLLLYQPGGKPDRPEIIQKANETGWDCPYGLTWLKGNSSASDCSTPYAPMSERILVFVPKGTKLEWHEQGLNRSDVIDIPRITRRATLDMHHGRTEYGSIHMFQKPDELCDLLVKKHTHFQEVVFEPFGCSASGCISAGKNGRRWIYTESNKQNFEWGSSRIDKQLRDSKLISA